MSELTGHLVLVKVAFGAVLVVSYMLKSTVHVAGDSSGWIVPLTFNFATNDHDVLQVPKASYDGCTDPQTHLAKLITTGPANVTVDSAGDHFYICTIGCHSQGGQKLSITVSAATGASPPSSSTPPPTAPITDFTCRMHSSDPSSSPTAGGPTTHEISVPPPPPTSTSSAIVAGVCPCPSSPLQWPCSFRSI